MTMPLDAIPRDRASRGFLGAASLPPRGLIVVAFAGVVVAAIALRATLLFNVDVSWWLTVSERMLDGQRLYVDILETNPPMAASVYLVGTILGRAFAIRPEIATTALIFAMIAASLATTCRILRRSLPRGTAATGVLIVWAAALLCILPMYDFGQREHLALLTLLPALAVLMRRADVQPVSWPMIAVAALGAAVTIGFKPYFVFAVGCAVLAAASHARRWQILFAPEHIIAAALVVLYGVAVYLAYPDYFTRIYPLVSEVYLLLRAPMLAIAMTSAVMLSIGAALLVFIVRGRRGIDSALAVMLAAAFGFGLAFFAQNKGWGYHAYPMIALALMAAGYAIATSTDAMHRSRPLRLAAVLTLAMLFVNACAWSNASVAYPQVERAVALRHPHPKLMVLSADAMIGHPMVRTLGGEWVSRQQAFWVHEIVSRAERAGEIDAATETRLGTYVARERDGIIADFKRQPPDVVLIDSRSDWGKWAAADGELAALLAPYTHAEMIDGIVLRSRP